MNNLNYGIIGNCMTGVLVSERGSIDWFCAPTFNASSVFAKILDKKTGGKFSFEVTPDYKARQFYIDKTNLLVTKFSNEKNDCFEIIDFMPRYKLEKAIYSPPDIIRYIRYISGSPSFVIDFDPKLEYARHETKTFITEQYIKSQTTKGDYDSTYLYSDLDKEKIINKEKIAIKKDHFLLLSYNQKILNQTLERSYLKMERTKVYWLNWSDRTRKYAKFNKEICRSALALKLLSFEKSGAVLAALTTSLPESIGGIRNWDYRFCWLRDASMVIKVMTNLGHINVAKRYIKFILDIIPDKDEKLQIMYGINGEKKLHEKILNYLSGYENSAPVRIGNAAYKQKQNDIYGLLMDVIYQQFNLFDVSLENSEELWTITRSVVRMVKRNWKKPDRGIWELRTEQKHFIFSKLLCWVAVDRAISVAKLVGRDDYANEWDTLRESIKKDIHKKGWNKKMQAFTQYYGSEDMDASNLLLESYGFISADDPKYKLTVKATKEHLCQDQLMYRYKNKDDFGLPSSSFTICTFWLIEALYKTGSKIEASRIFKQLLGYSNHLGLFSEGIDFKTKRLLGNFPQAYSHLALIETAITLSKGAMAEEEELLDAIHQHYD
jgi:alpha,alpha-trehalase